MLKYLSAFLLLGGIVISTILYAHPTTNLVEVICAQQHDAFFVKQTTSHSNEFTGTSSNTDSISQFINHQDKSGTCIIGSRTIQWQYQDYKEPSTPKGRCSAGYWGGTISIQVNDEPIIENTPIGGYLGNCPGSPLQSIKFAETDNSLLRLDLIGYWAPSSDAANFAVPLPLTESFLIQKLSLCAPVLSVDFEKAESVSQSSSCQTISRLGAKLDTKTLTNGLEIKFVPSK